MDNTKLSSDELFDLVDDTLDKAWAARRDVSKIIKVSGQAGQLGSIIEKLLPDLEQAWGAFDMAFDSLNHVLSVVSRLDELDLD